jgi:zinc transport system substrate-binding protein
VRRPLLLLLLLPALAASTLPRSALAEPLRVFASVIPIQTFIARIGGEHVDARAMVRPGFNPHTYDPTPQQIAALANAALYVRTGVPFEQAWMERIRSANPDMPVIDAREGIELRAMEAHGHGHGDKHSSDDYPKKDHHGNRQHEDEHHDRGSRGEAAADAHAAPQEPIHERGHKLDPHVWVSPPLVKQMVGVIRDKLVELAPAYTAAFDRNHDAFVAELDALDGELHALLDPLPDRTFMVFHPAWGYFADTYGLTQVAIEREGKEPGARGLAALIEQAKADGIKVLFVQPQFDRRQARQVAEAIGGRVIAVDPLAADYVDNLRRVGQEFAQALQP